MYHATLFSACIGDRVSRDINRLKTRREYPIYNIYPISIWYEQFRTEKSSKTQIIKYLNVYNIICIALIVSVIYVIMNASANTVAG